MEPERYNAEISTIRRQNAKSALKKLAAGASVILAVGVVIYSLLFLIMVML